MSIKDRNRKGSSSPVKETAWSESVWWWKCVKFKSLKDQSAMLWLNKQTQEVLNILSRAF